MADFSKALEKVLKWEGGISNNKNDSGGLTNQGITLATYNQFYEDGSEGLLHITPMQVRFIYNVGYWEKIQGDKINNQSIAELLFDFAVQSGWRTAVKKIQILVNVDADGYMGPKTLAAINVRDPHILFKELYDVRVGFYKLIVKKNPKNGVFLKGWINRISSYKYSE